MTLCFQPWPKWLYIIQTVRSLDRYVPSSKKDVCSYPGFGSQDEWRYNDKELAFYSASASAISVYWNKFSEPESEVWYYKWAIGTSRCVTQIQPLVNIGRRNYANTTMSELVFIPGVKYYVTVISRNRAGLVSQSCSDALVFDSTPPHPSIV